MHIYEVKLVKNCGMVIRAIKFGYCKMWALYVMCTVYIVVGQPKNCDMDNNSGLLFWLLYIRTLYVIRAVYLVVE